MLCGNGIINCNVTPFLCLFFWIQHVIISSPTVTFDILKKSFFKRAPFCPTPQVRLKNAGSNQTKRSKHHETTRLLIVRPEKLQNESFPNSSDFRSQFLPWILLRIFPEFFEDFSCFVSWETETRKKFTKNPHHFSMQNSQAKTKKNIHKILLGSRQSNFLKNKILKETSLLKGCLRKSDKRNHKTMEPTKHWPCM